MAFNQLIFIFSSSIFPDDIRRHEFLKVATLENCIKFFAVSWCKQKYTNDIVDNVFGIESKSNDQKAYLTAFKRKLKKSLFEYNSDEFDRQIQLDKFVKKYFNSIDILFNRLIDSQNNIDSKLIPDDDPTKKYISDTLLEINKLTNETAENKVFDVTHLKEAIKNFSAHFEIYLEHETSNNFRVNLTKNPKDYFVDEIVETEPRIVCFMDILGFSELINQYEYDITSTLLQDIQESFSLAKEQLLENSSFDQEAVKHLKYQTFSDNICISIPYFDNQDDFLANFNLLSVYTRGFQLLMMSKGIYMRGGISTGSYYADNNIIFSKGLVNAYLLESKKAIYPRVIIDSKLISKILRYDYTKIKYFGLDKTIVLDWENAAFLNPFGMTQSAIHQLESIISEIDDDSETEDDPMSKILNTFSKTVTNLTIDLIKANTTGEDNNLKSIKENILRNIEENIGKENIISKYVWIWEFVKWLEKDPTTKLHFSYFDEFLN